MINASIHIAYFAPVLLLTVWALGLLLAEALIPLTARHTAWIALIGLGLTGLFTLAFDASSVSFWGDLCKWDGAAKFFNLFFVATAILVIWMGDEIQEPFSHGGGEFVVLPLFTTIGLMLLAMANDFTLFFVSLELVTISFYILVAYQRRSPVAIEAGIKYLILGGLSSAFLVMGIAYIYGLTGTTRFDLMEQFMPAYLQVYRTGIAFGLLLVLVGIGFKIAMVPFHIWAPDVYEGAPNSITAFLSVGSKAGGFIILMRVVLGIFGGVAGSHIWLPVLSVAAMLSLVLGNLAAIPQRNLKRLLGYSSIGHTGFILVAVIGAVQLAPSEARPPIMDLKTGQVAVSIYLVTYLLATFTAFIVLAVLNRRLPGLEIHHLAGLSQRSPLLAAAFALSFISLAGIPPLSGFIAKFMVILVAWNRGFYTLLGFAIFAAVAALYYYLGPVKAMYWSEPLDETPIRINLPTTIVLSILIVLLIGTGFWAQSYSIFVNDSNLAQASLHAAGSFVCKQ
ncbi:MAG TPA: NADH-quinone oxidoreductase subunit N [Candidatus Methylacidiphilales bacterium]|nr:NADH-quinone oxidoreductase subunit N [Candidatus Methylacidiphilales bacterium]